MKVLHIKLKSIGDGAVEFRYYWDNPNNFQKRILKLSEIKNLIKSAELDYYTPLPEDFVKTGRKLFNWLDGDNRCLVQMLEPFQRKKGLVIAIATAEKLAHLPWELLHDESGFLVERYIIPIRWLSEESSQETKKPANRPLRVLFMATSPLEVEPVLNFEEEEAKILKATKKQPLQLEVEESGCLTELGNTVQSYTSEESDYFDVLHLTGHAAILDGQPRFLTETEIGERYEASAEDIADALSFSIPRLVFLSGCRTGQAASAGAVPSMAEALLKEGATAILGWGRSVLDIDATKAAVALYSSLASGKSVSQALALTYQALIKQNARDWHLLRLYVAGEIPGSLVTPKNTLKRKKLIEKEAAKEFLDVTKRQGFVGRRRPLQNCLRALGIESDLVGVLIHGMGGLGKSTLAARICERLASRFERLVWVGKIDEPELVTRLEKKLEAHEPREQLQNSTEELKFKIRRVFKHLAEEEVKEFLFVLDDFEQNLEQREQGFVLSLDAAKVLTALAWAVQESGLVHRLIITSRYVFNFSELQHFYKQPLAALSPTDIQKKCSGLESFQTNSKIAIELQKQALKIADGNPRLLEWLNEKISQDNTTDHAEFLASLAKDATELREQVLTQELLICIDESMQQMLQLGRVFEIPVPQAAFLEICADVFDLFTHINRAIALGLLEINIDQTIKVSRILPLNIEHSKQLYNQAAQCLYRLWQQECQLRTEQQLLEIHRLALLGKNELIAADICDVLSLSYDNASRFRDVISLCKSTLDIVSDQTRKMIILNNLGNAYNNLGLHKDAISLFQESKWISETVQNKDLSINGAIIGNLGISHYHIGQIEQAINYYIKAISIALNSRNEDLQALWHSNIGVCYSSLGNIEQAIHHYEEALALSETRNPTIKAICCCNLCDCYGIIGDSNKAITYAQRSLTIQEEIINLEGKATTLHALAEVLINEERYNEAIYCTKQAIDLAEIVMTPQLYSENYSAMAFAYLCSDEDKLSDAWNAAREAQKHDFPKNNHYTLLLLGLIILKQDNYQIAYDKFTDALFSAEKLISECEYNFKAWDTKFISLCGLVLSTKRSNQNYITDAAEAYQKARTINQYNGTIKRVLKLFEILRTVDHQNCLDTLQKSLLD